MFSFFQSAPDPALLRVGKCPSWWHTHPSRGCTSHPWCPEETQTSSRRYKLNRCPARRKKNPLLHRRHPPPHHHHLLPLPAVTPVQARTKLESWNSLGLKFGKKEALGLSRSCQWPSVWGSSSFETSEESELNKKEEKKKGWCLWFMFTFCRQNMRISCRTVLWEQTWKAPTELTHIPICLPTLPHGLLRTNVDK